MAGLLPPDPVFTLRNSEMGSVNCLCFHKNERLLAGTIKGNIHLWNLEVCLFTCFKKMLIKIYLNFRQIVLPTKLKMVQIQLCPFFTQMNH